MLLDLVRVLFFPALMVFAAVSDVLTMTISNRISLLLAGGFVVLALGGGMALPLIAWHFAAAAVVLCCTFFMFAMGWIGGGDAKLAAAIALWFGFEQMTPFLIYASLFGGALTLLILQFRGWPLPYVLGSQAWLVRLHDKDSGVPYGIALALGAMPVYPDSPWMRAVNLGALLGG